MKKLSILLAMLFLFVDAAAEAQDEPVCGLADDIIFAVAREGDLPFMLAHHTQWSGTCSCFAPNPQTVFNDMVGHPCARSANGARLVNRPSTPPSDNAACGSEKGINFGSALFGGTVNILDCCIQHDRDWSTCDLPRWVADTRIGQCAASKCGWLATLGWPFSRFYPSCLAAAKSVEWAVTNTAEATNAYIDSKVGHCYCAPCGWNGQQCELLSNAGYPIPPWNEPWNPPGFPTYPNPEPGADF